MQNTVWRGTKNIWGNAQERPPWIRAWVAYHCCQCNQVVNRRAKLQSRQLASLAVVHTNIPGNQQAPTNTTFDAANHALTNARLDAVENTGASSESKFDSTARLGIAAYLKFVLVDLIIIKFDWQQRVFRKQRFPFSRHKTLNSWCNTAHAPQHRPCLHVVMPLENLRGALQISKYSVRNRLSRTFKFRWNY